MKRRLERRKICSLSAEGWVASLWLEELPRALGPRSCSDPHALRPLLRQVLESLESLEVMAGADLSIASTQCWTRPA